MDRRTPCASQEEVFNMIIADFEAAAAAKRVIDSGAYRLLDDYANNFEQVFEVQFMQDDPRLRATVLMEGSTVGGKTYDPAGSSTGSNERKYLYKEAVWPLLAPSGSARSPRHRTSILRGANR